MLHAHPKVYYILASKKERWLLHNPTVGFVTSNEPVAVLSAMVLALVFKIATMSTKCARNNGVDIDAKVASSATLSAI